MTSAVADGGNELTLQQLVRLMKDAGVQRLYAKDLAPNDNSKNQVYLGADFHAANVIPIGRVQTNEGSSRKQRVHNADGASIFKAPVEFAWIDHSGVLATAPDCQLILYPQYPEVRMSGFLRGCSNAPTQVMASRDKGRILFLGITRDRKVIGYAASVHSALRREMDSHTDFPLLGVFLQIPVEKEDPRTELLRELRRIHQLDWITSKRLLRGGGLAGCSAPNCGGYTLEAELGIEPNSLAEPDFRGWEVKQYKVSDFGRIDTGVLTLMTPEPTGGYYNEQGIEAFVRKFGYSDLRGRADRLNFGGIHRADVRHPRTGLTLTLIGFDAQKGKIVDPKGGIALVGENEAPAALWSFSGLIEHWQRKHAFAAYVPSQSRMTPERQYRFSPRVKLGEGTDIVYLLSAFASGQAYYDPGIKVEGASTDRPKSKRRSQFRIRSANLSALYDSLETVDLV